MAKIELPEGWAGVAEPLRAVITEIDREARTDGATPADLAAVSARWTQVSHAIRNLETTVGGSGFPLSEPLGIAYFRTRRLVFFRESGIDPICVTSQF